jgi:hypothetical protein
MFAMFNQFFAMLSTLFSAGEKGANALNHLATWGEETAGAFADESRINRQAKMKALRTKTGVTQAEVPDQAPIVIAAE